MALTCGVVNMVETNKRHRVNNRDPKVFDINTKSALGIQILLNMCCYIFLTLYVFCYVKFAVT